MADHLTPAQRAAIDATVARVQAERADAPTMAAKYDAACERISEMHDEIVGLRRKVEALEDTLRDRSARIAEVEEERDAARDAARTYLHTGSRLINERDVELYHARALADRRWVAWQSARRRARQQRDALREAMAADRDQVRRARDRYRTERNDANAEITRLRAQLAATTNPARAEARLAADAHPGTERSTNGM